MGLGLRLCGDIGIKYIVRRPFSLAITSIYEFMYSPVKSHTLYPPRQVLIHCIYQLVIVSKESAKASTPLSLDSYKQSLALSFILSLL